MMVDLSGVSPGWRGTDPDGGTWVLTDRGNRFPWFVVHADGSWQWMTQEAAEAAGLVRLIPAVGYHYDERGEDVVPDVEVDAAPAPLDPGNPEHLRQVVKFVITCYIGEDDDVIAEQIRALATSLHSRADRLDRERAEAEQDAADRKLIEGSIREAIPAIGARTYEQAAEFEAVAEAVLRAERARQETGQ